MKRLALALVALACASAATAGGVVAEVKYADGGRVQLMTTSPEVKHCNPAWRRLRYVTSSGLSNEGCWTFDSTGDGIRAKIMWTDYYWPDSQVEYLPAWSTFAEDLAAQQRKKSGVEK